MQFVTAGQIAALLRCIASAVCNYTFRCPDRPLVRPWASAAQPWCRDWCWSGRCSAGRPRTACIAPGRIWHTSSLRRCGTVDFAKITSRLKDALLLHRRKAWLLKQDSSLTYLCSSKCSCCIHPHVGLQLVVAVAASVLLAFPVYGIVGLAVRLAAV